MITGSFFLPFSVLFGIIGVGIVLLTVLLSVSFIKKRKGGRGVFSVAWGRRVCAAALLLSLPFLVMAAYRAYYADSFKPYEKQETLTVTGMVRSVSYAYDSSAQYVFLTKSINGNDKKVKITLTVPSDSLVHVGDEICAQVQPVALATATTVTERLSSAANGIVGAVIISDASSVSVSAIGNTSFAGVWRTVNERAAQRLLDACGKKQGGLIAAVLLGRKDLLDDTIVRDFARSGISHVLALSGFHVSVLAGGMEFILKKCRIGKGTRMAVCTFLLLLFLCLTGFSLSAQRSVIMLFILFCSRWLYADSDSPTFLAVTVAMMMTFFPASAVDVSLWMSFAATFGVLLGVAFIQKMPHGQKTFAKIIEKTASGIVVSLFAIVCVLPISFLYFGTISVMAPVATMVAVPLSYVLMLGGIVTLAVSCVFGPGAARSVAAIPEFAGRLMTAIMSKVSQMHGVVYSLRFSFVPAVLILLLVLFFLWMVMHWEKKWTVVIPLICTVGIYGVCYTVWRDNTVGYVSLTYVGAESSETLLMSRADESVMVDVGNGYYSVWRDGWDALEAAGSTELSALCLTHYHTAQIGSVEKIASRVLIRRLIVPEPTNETEYYILSALYEKAQVAGIPVFIYQNGMEMTLFEAAHLNVYRADITGSSHPVLALSLTGNDGKFIYLGSSVTEEIENCNTLLEGCTCLLLGKHGPSGKQQIDVAVPACKALIIPKSETVALLSDSMLQSIPVDCSIFLDTFWWKGQPVSLDNKDGTVIK